MFGGVVVGWLGPLIVFRDGGLRGWGGVSPPPISILDCAADLTDGSLAGSILAGGG